jgi:hypothetical protein
MFQQAFPMTDQGQTSRPPMPLFYSDPQPLSSIAHADWRLKAGAFEFARDAHVVPLVVAEFIKASRWYPILFAAEGAAPVALVGLERRNLFVADGDWTAGAYVPAYVRRYPFGFMGAGPDQFALAIDAASDRVAKGGDEGEPLFVDGKPGPLTQQALEFCDAFQGEAAATSAFCEAIVAKDLLVDRRADVTTPDGRRFAIEGFRLIDPAKFAALDAETVVAWHARGWLGLAQFHLASLDRFAELMALQNDVAVTPAAE